jgi:trigger factor
MIGKYMTEQVQETTETRLVHDLDVVVSDDSIADISVSFEAAELHPYQKKYLEEKRKHVILRGFRKGTAPESMVSKYFAAEAKESAKNNLLYAKYSKILQEHKLQPLAQPILAKLIEEDSKVTANFKVEVLQPIILNQYLALELQKMPSRSTQEIVVKTYNDIKDKYPKLVALPDGVAESGKVAIVDFTMDVDGEEFEKQNDLNVILGANLFYSEFENNVLGLKAGDKKEFDVTFPETYQGGLKGKTAHFNLSVKVINEVAQHSDDELAQLLNYENKDAIIASIQKEVEHKSKEEENLYYENQILGQLLSTHQFKLPRILVEAEIKKILAEKPDTAKEQAVEIAERFVRTDLVLNAINERHPDIALKEDAFKVKLTELALRANDTFENVVQKLQEAGKLQSYYNYLRNCEVVKFLIEMADIKEVVAEVKSDVVEVAI